MTFNETLTDWLSSFWKILVSPTPKTFLAESEKAENKFSSAMLWLVLFAVYLSIFSIILSGQFLFTFVIVAVLVIPAFVLIFTSTLHFVHQRIYKRKQYIYDKLLYITVAALLPIHILTTPISTALTLRSFITVNLILNYSVYLYQLILMVIAVKSVTKLEYWQAVTTVLISVVAAALAALCTIPFIFSMIGGVNSTLR